MNFAHAIRQLHRWVSILFVLAVVANFVAMAFGPTPPWITYSPLPPLALLVPSGLYLFVLPYRSRRVRDPSVREGDA
ncbi:hypothetical protein [Pseudoxanthomonas kaohsiungensis]|uniref:Transmembrane protein n=1 Tax=Pseudoxanthomonas kaohsiungensis TaxID=283923 RepID=A0ABW3M2R0_9GAMM|nr:hypothetical protein [Pseudoxanthomonas kaohsiungensis]KAF1700900.1 hypothetical protein CSC66_15200 [Pseudoxanthomonas kaohsiungensis]